MPNSLESELTWDDAKSLGAFYTDTQVAEFLVWWAVRSASDTVLDPSFGGGVFLRAAAKRLESFGGNSSSQVFGVEVDDSVHERITRLLADEFAIPRHNLTRSDFFASEPCDRNVKVVVGNPPFIRYQRFTGEVRERALRCAAQLGVSLSKLSSSWLPFLLHSIAHLRKGGRLAMVIPNELTYANYAGPALSFLQHSFSEVTFLTFQEKLFPHLSEDTLLLLAEGKGGGPARFRWRDLPHPGRLADLQRMALPIPKTRVLNANRLSEGKERLIEYLLPAKARTLYRELVAGNTAVALGEIADVGIGYVTGANNYFHLSSAAAASLSIPPSFLRPALRRGRSLDAVCFNEYDLQNAITSGDASYLLYIKPQDALPASVRRYIEQGEKAGIPNAYKCRARKPWYCVPQVYSADAFLSYMSGMTPKLVSNDTLAVAPNSLHVLRMHESSTTSKHELAARWQTSLTRLSCEIEGHSLGGGMLKLEPTEAERVLIPAPRSAVKAALANELDLISRTKGEDAARHHADSILLRRGLGLSSSDCALLRQAATCLLERRYQRGAA